MAKIIGFAGAAGSGKDTAARCIKMSLPGHVVIRSFAHPMKEMLKVGLGWGDEHVHGHLKDTVCPKYGFSPRKALQTLGTEWRNMLSRDLWLTAMQSTLQASDWLLIPDARFEHEANWIRSQGGMIIEIVRPTENNPRADVRQHVSESGLPAEVVDATVLNNGRFSDLHRNVMDAIERVTNERPAA